MSDRDYRPAPTFPWRTLATGALVITLAYFALEERPVPTVVMGEPTIVAPVPQGPGFYPWAARVPGIWWDDCLQSAPYDRSDLCVYRGT